MADNEIKHKQDELRWKQEEKKQELEFKKTEQKKEITLELIKQGKSILEIKEYLELLGL
jgi:hypothetical protein